MTPSRTPSTLQPRPRCSFTDWWVLGCLYLVLVLIPGGLLIRHFVSPEDDMPPQHTLYMSTARYQVKIPANLSRWDHSCRVSCHTDQPQQEGASDAFRVAELAVTRYETNATSLPLLGDASSEEELQRVLQVFLAGGENGNESMLVFQGGQVLNASWTGRYI